MNINQPRKEPPMDDMETPESKSIWNKTQDELTLGDSMKATAVVTTIMVAGTVVLTAAPVVVTHVRDKIRSFRARRADKSTQDETPEEL